MSLIDIRLVLTQIVGFLILLWALRKWAWGPVLGMLEQRRQAIAGQFADAERLQAEADQAKARWEQELRGIEAQARQRIQEAMAEGQKLAGEIKSRRSPRRRPGWSVPGRRSSANASRPRSSSSSRSSRWRCGRPRRSCRKRWTRRISVSSSTGS